MKQPQIQHITTYWGLIPYGNPINYKPTTDDANAVVSSSKFLFLTVSWLHRPTALASWDAKRLFLTVQTASGPCAVLEWPQCWYLGISGDAKSERLEISKWHRRPKEHQVAVAGSAGCARRPCARRFVWHVASNHQTVRDRVASLGSSTERFVAKPSRYWSNWSRATSGGFEDSGCTRCNRCNAFDPGSVGASHSTLGPRRWWGCSAEVLGPIHWRGGLMLAGGLPGLSSKCSDPAGKHSEDFATFCSWGHFCYLDASGYIWMHFFSQHVLDSVCVDIPILAVNIPTSHFYHQFFSSSIMHMHTYYIYIYVDMMIYVCMHVSRI